MTQPGPTRLAPDELRTLFLFESLDEDKLQSLADSGRVRVGDTDIELTRTNQRGAYAGAMQAYVRTEEPGPYAGSMFAVTEARFFVIPAADWGKAGLDISYRIVVQRHGGDLSVVSEPGDTRFQVRLPLQAPASQPLPT